METLSRAAAPVMADRAMKSVCLVSGVVVVQRVPGLAYIHVHCTAEYGQLLPYRDDQRTAGSYCKRSLHYRDKFVATELN